MGTKVIHPIDGIRGCVPVSDQTTEVGLGRVFMIKNRLDKLLIDFSNQAFAHVQDEEPVVVVPLPLEIDVRHCLSRPLRCVGLGRDNHAIVLADSDTDVANLDDPARGRARAFPSPGA